MTDEATASCRLDGETRCIEPPKDIPVLLKGPLVTAFLAGQKTVTRRTDLAKWRRAKPGDRIWFKETFQHHFFARDGVAARGVRYRADGAMLWNPNASLTSDKSWRRSIFMPKWAARCWAVIEDIREEKLQDITEEDAKREGVKPYDGIHPDQRVPGPGFDWSRLGDEPHRLPFADLWDEINGKKPGLSWNDNPTVARVQFRRIEVPA